MAVKEKNEQKVHEVLSFEERLLKLRLKNSKEKSFLLSDEKEAKKMCDKK